MVLVKSMGEGVLVSGLAASFGTVDRGGDVIAPGAFAESLDRLRREGRRLPMLWQHEAGEVIGVWDRVAETAEGLEAGGVLVPDVQRGREAIALVEAGALRGLSIGYRVMPGGAAMEPGTRRRRLTRLELVEISLVTFPMNDKARVFPGKDFGPGGALAALRALSAKLAGR
jgi:HK97 family phage prohead protease